MLINNYKGGRLANRIYAFGHFIANSLEHGYKLYNPEFDEYSPYFEATSKNLFEGHPISVTIFKNRTADRIFSFSVRLWADLTHKLFTRTPFYILYRLLKTNIYFEMNDPQFLAEVKDKTVIAEGWNFRDHDSFIKHADAIRRFFAPVDIYRTQVETLMATVKKEADCIIGVHIRRGDYIRYNNGDWYYTDDVYAEKMLQVQEQMAAKGKTCAFFISSYEGIDVVNYPKDLKLLTGNRHFMVDLYSLAECDGIIGPPSTFSQWASFYGQVPLTFINSKNDVVTIGDYEHARNP